MNTKTLFICLTILAILTFSAQSLTIGKHSEHHMAKTLAKQLSHKVFSYHFQNQNAPKVPNDVIQGLTALMLGDSEMLDQIMSGEKLSPSSIKKIQNFFINNKSFNDAMVKSFDQDPSFPQCYKDLKPGQKKKFITILISQMDFNKILNQEDDANPSDDDVQKIKQAINSDKELGPKVSQCLQGHIELPTV